MRSKMYAIILLIIAFAMVSAGCAKVGSEESTTTTVATTSSTTTAPTTTTTVAVTTTTEAPVAEEVAACSTWERADLDHGDNHRWFADGLDSIRGATTPEEAEAAAMEWLSLIRGDAELLSGAALYFGYDLPVEIVFDEDNCATSQAAQVVNAIELALVDGEVTPEEAPSDGVNSGVADDGSVTVATSAGISGDRAAVKIVTKTEVTVWVMARCGNVVTPTPPTPIPPGPTDEKDPSKNIERNPDVPEKVKVDKPVTVGPPDDPSTHDPDNSDVQDDGYCQSCAEPTAPPPEAVVTTTTTTVPDEGDAGEAVADHGDPGPPPPPGGDAGISDPTPDPNPPSEQPPVEGDPCDDDPSLPTCDG